MPADEPPLPGPSSSPDPGDPADLHADLLPGVKRVTIDDDGDPDRLLSSIVRRYADSGLTDRRWWTRSGDAPARARA